MFNKKEIAWIIIAIIILEFIILFPLKKDFNILMLIISPLIISVSVISKKIFSKNFSIKIEYKIWEFQRWGFYKRSHFKKPFPIGLILPFVLSLFSLGLIKMLAFLQFDYKNIKEIRILKQSGFKRKSEINDYDAGMTSAIGFYSLILLAVIGSLISFPELAKYSIIYSLWNLIPFGKLDGSRLFFGSVINWFIILILNIIGLVLILILV